MQPIKPPAFLVGRPARHRQLLAVAILLLLLTGFYSLIASPIVNMYLEDRAAITRSSMLVVRYETILSGLRLEVAAWRQLEDKTRQQAYLFPDQEVPVAVTRFEEYVRNQSRVSGLEVKRLLPGAPQSSEMLTHLSMSIELKGTPGAIADLVFALENEPPLARFDRFELTYAPDNPNLVTLKADLKSFMATPEGTAK